MDHQEIARAAVFIWSLLVIGAIGYSIGYVRGRDKTLHSLADPVPGDDPFNVIDSHRRA